MTDWPFGHLTPLSYDVIVIDPPWSFMTWSNKGSAKGAATQYDVMSTNDIKALPISRLAQRDALLLLWATAPMLPVAVDVMQAWGFEYKSEMIWRKVTANNKTRMGTGYWCRSMHEPILIGTIGKPSKIRAFPSIFDGIAREHSRKPEEFFDIVERHTSGMRRLELFSRQSRSCWETWGNERTKFDDSMEAAQCH